MSDDVDPQDLLDRIEALEAATSALKAYGMAHDLPVVERSATRIAGTVAVLRGNVPGGLAPGNDPGESDEASLSPSDEASPSESDY